MFEEEFEDAFDPQLEAKLEAWREKMIIEAIEANYDNLIEKGVSEWHLRSLEQEEKDQMLRTFQTMLDHFESEEEYEKCAEMVKFIKTLKESIAERV